MTLSDRGRDWVVTSIFLAVVGGLVVVGWLTRESFAGPPPAGELAPDFALPRLDGGSASLSEYRGRVVMLNIWATWCAPCRQEMPSMQRVYERFRSSGFEILAVSVDAAPGEPGEGGGVEGRVSRFVDELGLTFPVLLDPSGRIQQTYGVVGLPTTVLIDRAGRVRVREVGGRFWDREPQLSMIARLVEE